MSTGQSYEQAIAAFTTLLYHKGYRGDYLLDKIVPGRPMIGGQLSNCLRVYIKVYENATDKPVLLQLETSPPYNGHIRCQLKIAFNEINGFQIRKMEITDTISGRGKTYHITHNQQLPGSQSIAALFPKPKPWDNHLKGKFRP